jgi:hypothetical protein
MMIKEQHSAISKPAKNKRFKQSYGLNFACWNGFSQKSYLLTRLLYLSLLKIIASFSRFWN